MCRIHYHICYYCLVFVETDMIVTSTFGAGAIFSYEAHIQNKMTINKVFCNTCIWRNMFVN